MANAKSRSLGPSLSTAEQVAGFCYLPFYVILLAMGIRWLSGLLDLSLTELQINAVYFVLNTIFDQHLWSPAMLTVLPLQDWLSRSRGRLCSRVRMGYHGRRR